MKQRQLHIGSLRAAVSDDAPVETPQNQLEWVAVPEAE